MFDGLLVVNWLSAKQLPSPPNQARSASPESDTTLSTTRFRFGNQTVVSGIGTSADAGDVVVVDPVAA